MRTLIKSITVAGLAVIAVGLLFSAFMLGHASGIDWVVPLISSR